MEVCPDVVCVHDPHGRHCPTWARTVSRVSAVVQTQYRRSRIKFLCAGKGADQLLELRDIDLAELCFGSEIGDRGPMVKKLESGGRQLDLVSAATKISDRHFTRLEVRIDAPIERIPRVIHLLTRRAQISHSPGQRLSRVHSFLLPVLIRPVRERYRRHGLRADRHKGSNEPVTALSRPISKPQTLPVSSRRCFHTFLWSAYWLAGRSS